MNCEAENYLEVKDLMSEIDERSRSPSVFNLSRDHAPIAVLLNENCVVSTLHFRQLSDDKLKREAFRQAVYYIDVENLVAMQQKMLILSKFTERQIYVQSIHGR